MTPQSICGEETRCSKLTRSSMEPVIPRDAPPTQAKVLESLIARLFHRSNMLRMLCLGLNYLSKKFHKHNWVALYVLRSLREAKRRNRQFAWGTSWFLILSWEAIYATLSHSSTLVVLQNERNLVKPDSDAGFSLGIIQIRYHTCQVPLILRGRVERAYTSMDASDDWTMIVRFKDTHTK